MKNPFPSPWVIHGLYGLGWLACFFWLGGFLPYHPDILAYVYPEKSFNLECLQKGWIPLWNPYLSCGVPHLANWLSSFFYPPGWFLEAVGLSKGLVLLALLHGAWAYGGFHLWARSQKIPGWACALGAFSFAGSAAFVRCWPILPFIAALSWIPWVFLGVSRALERRGPVDKALAVLALSLQLLAGYPLFCFYTWAVLLAWVVFQNHSLPRMGRAGLLFAASLVLTAFQWMPFLEFLTFSSHGHWGRFPYYTHPWEYLTLLQPTAAGVPGAADYRSDPTNSPFGNLYFGLIPFLIWMAAWGLKKFRGGFWSFSPAILLAWMAGPLVWIFIPAQGFDFLEPSKAVGLFLFTACTAVSLFLGKTGDLLFKNPWRTALASALAALWILDLLVLPFRLTYRVPNPYQDPGLQGQAEKIRERAGGQRVLAMQDSGQMTASGPQMDESLERKISGHLAGNFLPNTNMAWGLRFPTAYLALQTDNLKNMTRYLDKGFPYPGGLLEVAGVKAFFLPQPLPAPKYGAAGKIGENFLSLDPQASEDMRWVGEALDFPDRPSLLNRLAAPGSGWRQKVYLEGNPGEKPVQLPPVSRPLAFAPVSAYTRLSAGQAGALTNFSKPGYLVWDESYAPGWHAWVDGAPQPILRAYGLFMAVELGKGPHQVDFRYEPASFRLGLFMALAALVFGGAALSWKN